MFAICSDILWTSKMHSGNALSILPIINYHIPWSSSWPQVTNGIVYAGGGGGAVALLDTNDLRIVSSYSVLRSAASLPGNRSRGGTRPGSGCDVISCQIANKFQNLNDTFSVQRHSALGLHPREPVAVRDYPVLVLVEAVLEVLAPCLEVRVELRLEVRDNGASVTLCMFKHPQHRNFFITNIIGRGVGDKHASPNINNNQQIKVFLIIITTILLLFRWIIFQAAWTQDDNLHREASSVNESSVDMITDVVGMALFQVLHGHNNLHVS